MRMKVEKNRIIAVVLTLVLLLGLCSTTTYYRALASDDEESARTELVLADSEWAGTLTYLNTNAGLLFCLIDDCMLYVDEDGNYGPNTCESYEVSEDGTLITIHLPDEMYFWDGTPVTAYDAEVSLKYGLEVSPMKSSWGAITDVTSEGQDLFIHMDDGYSNAILFQLASVMMPIACAEDINTMSETDLWWNARIYASYYVDEYVSGDHVTLKSNQYYKSFNPNLENQGAPYVDTITVRFMDDNFAIMQSLAAGEIDLYGTNLTYENLEELYEMDNITVKTWPNFSVYYMIMNPVDETLESDNMRMAIQYLIDRDMLEEFTDGYLTGSYAFSVEGTVNRDNLIDDWYKENYTREDLTDALELLAEEGWTDSDGDGYLDKDGQILEITLSTNVTVDVINNLVQIMFQNAGIMLNLDQRSSSSEIDTLLDEGDYQIVLTGNSFGEMSCLMSAYISRVGYCNDAFSDEDVEELQEMLTEATRCETTEESAPIWYEFQKKILETNTFIPLTSNTRIQAYASDIVDEVYYRNDSMKLWLSDVK